MLSYWLIKTIDISNCYKPVINKFRLVLILFKYWFSGNDIDICETELRTTVTSIEAVLLREDIALSDIINVTRIILLNKFNPA